MFSLTVFMCSRFLLHTHTQSTHTTHFVTLYMSLNMSLAVLLDPGSPQRRYKNHETAEKHLADTLSIPTTKFADTLPKTSPIHFQGASADTCRYIRRNSKKPDLSTTVTQKRRRYILKKASADTCRYMPIHFRRNGHFGAKNGCHF